MFARLFVAGILVAGVHNLILAALPVYLGERGATPSLIGIVVGAYAVAQAAFRLLGSWTVDRFPHRAMLLVGGGLLTAAFLGYAVMPVGWGLLLPRLAHGLGLAVFYTTAYAWISLSTAPERRGGRMGLYGSGTGVALVLMPLTGIAIFERWGPTPLFLLGAAAAALTLLFTVPSVPVARREVRGSLPALGNPLAVIALGFSTLGMLEAFMPSIARERAVDSLIGVYLLFGVGLGVGRAGGGALSDRLGRRPVAVGGLGLALASLLGLGVARGDLQVASCGLAYGVALGMAAAAIFTHVADRAPADRQGAALGLASLAQDLGVAGGAGVAGVVAEFSLAAVCWLGAALAFLALILTAGRREPAGRPSETVPGTAGGA